MVDQHLPQPLPAPQRSVTSLTVVAPEQMAASTTVLATHSQWHTIML
jgi:hypothetical protein